MTATFIFWTCSRSRRMDAGVFPAAALGGPVEDDRFQADAPGVVSTKLVSQPVLETLQLGTSRRSNSESSEPDPQLARFPTTSPPISQLLDRVSRPLGRALPNFQLSNVQRRPGPLLSTPSATQESVHHSGAACRDQHRDQRHHRDADDPRRKRCPVHHGKTEQEPGKESCQA